jgi:hypothetical protein
MNGEIPDELETPLLVVENSDSNSIVFDYAGPWKARNRARNSASRSSFGLRDQFDRNLRSLDNAVASETFFGRGRDNEDFSLYRPAIRLPALCAADCTGLRRLTKR